MWSCCMKKRQTFSPPKAKTATLNDEINNVKETKEVGYYGVNGVNSANDDVKITELQLPEPALKRTIIIPKPGERWVDVYTKKTLEIKAICKLQTDIFYKLKNIQCVVYLETNCVLTDYYFARPLKDFLEATVPLVLSENEKGKDNCTLTPRFIKQQTIPYNSFNEEQITKVMSLSKLPLPLPIDHDGWEEV